MLRAIAVLLILLGLSGLACTTLMFGDIGVAAGIGGLSALLSGIGFFIVGSKLSKSLK